jgi:hypothetical protein
MATMVMVIMEWHNRRMNNEYGSNRGQEKPKEISRVTVVERSWNV